MNLTQEALEASRKACRKVSRTARSNFPATFVLLPPAKRQAMYALYAFMRHSDDLADNKPNVGTAAEALHAWRHALAVSLDAPGSLDASRSLDASKSLDTVLINDPIGRSILPAVREAIVQFSVPTEHLYAVLDGVEMDLSPKSYDNFADLELYCRRVASAVGLACIYVWGFEGDAVFAPSHAAGMALQLTNILRDLKEDAAQGRIYLPREDFVQVGYSADELRAGAVNDGFLRLINLEAARAEEYYRHAEALIPHLHRDGKRIYGLMIATYRALLRAIRRRPAAVFERRVRLSNVHKLWIAARWACLPIDMARQIEHRRVETP